MVWLKNTVTIEHPVAGHLLGDETDFYKRKLGEMWAVKNNWAGAQYRNLCERQVQLAKKNN